MVEFTDALQGGLELLIVAQPLLDEGLLFGGEADLFVAPTGIADGQHPDEMALAARTDGATGAMADAAAEQGATKDLGSGGGAAASLARVLMIVSCFIYNNETAKRWLGQSFRNIYFKLCLASGGRREADL